MVKDVEKYYIILINKLVIHILELVLKVQTFKFIVKMGHQAILFNIMAFVKVRIQALRH